MENFNIIKHQSDRESYTIQDLKGLNSIIFEAFQGVTHISESLHYAILTLGGLLNRQDTLVSSIDKKNTSQPYRNHKIKGIPKLIYHGIRSASSWLDTNINRFLNQLEQHHGKSKTISRFEREVLISALNGFCGDYLLDKKSPLSIAMQIYHGDLPTRHSSIRENIFLSKGRVLLMIPGACMSDLQWYRESQNHGLSLAKIMNAVPLYLNYNTGKHISHNGTELAEQLGLLCDEYPEISEISILGYSMGGLVARSAHYYAKKRSAHWTEKLTTLVFLGTPHHGSALERGGNIIDNLLGTNLYSSPFQKISRLRSSGITDLRYGNIIDEDWSEYDRFRCVGDQRVPAPLPNNTKCFSVAATMAKTPSNKRKNWVGDGLVAVSSALGMHTDPKFNLLFPEHHQSIITDCHHFQLLSDKRVETTLFHWLA